MCIRDSVLAAKVTEIIRNYISYVKDNNRYEHPEDPDFVQELSEKLKEIQPELGEPIITKSQNEYQKLLTKPHQREDVILYLLFCEHIPYYVYYVQYSKPRPIDNEIVEEIKSYSRYLKGMEEFRIKPCDIPEGRVPGIVVTYKLHKLTGLEYLTLLLMYANRNTEVEDFVMGDLVVSYMRYVNLHSDLSLIHI